MIKIKHLMHWPFIVFQCFLVPIFFIGCATKMAVTPKVPANETKSDFQMGGIIEYDGNKEYLPRTLKEDMSQTAFSFKYEYQITYGRDKTPQALPLLNPLSMVGFPVGENTLVITGNLTILKGQEVIKEYKATCGLEKVRSLFSEGDTFSELRKKGLLAVRDNIELQMCHDKDFLLGLESGD